MVSYIYFYHTPVDQYYQVIPNSVISITIVLQGETVLQKTSGTEKFDHVSVFGLITRHTPVFSKGGYKEITIGLHPYCFQQLVREKMSLLANHVYDANQLFNPDEVNRLYESLHASEGNEEIVLPAVNRFITYHHQPHKQDHRLEYLNRLIIHDPGLKVKDLSEKAHLSSRMLQKLFEDKIGYSPKEALMISRIRKALASARYPHHLTQLALSLGYYDQAHFIHDFQKIVGKSPGEYFKNERLVSDFFSFDRIL